MCSRETSYESSESESRQSQFESRSYTIVLNHTFLGLTRNSEHHVTEESITPGGQMAFSDSCSCVHWPRYSDPYCHH